MSSHTWLTNSRQLTHKVDRLSTTDWAKVREVCQLTINVVTTDLLCQPGVLQLVLALPDDAKLPQYSYSRVVCTCCVL